MLKDIDVAEFLKTIRSVYEGSQVLPPHLTGSLFSQIVQRALNGLKPAEIDDAVRMTKRERQVIELIADGSTNKEIAETTSPFDIYGKKPRSQHSRKTGA